MKKKILTITLTAVLAISTLTACSDTVDNENIAISNEKSEVDNDSNTIDNSELEMENTIDNEQLVIGNESDANNEEELSITHSPLPTETPEVSSTPLPTEEATTNTMDNEQLEMGNDNNSNNNDEELPITNSPLPTAKPTATPSSLPTVEPTPVATPTPTELPTTNSPLPTEAPVVTPQPTPVPTAVPSCQHGTINDKIHNSHTGTFKGHMTVGGCSWDEYEREIEFVCANCKEHYRVVNGVDKFNEVHAEHQVGENIAGSCTEQSFHAGRACDCGAINVEGFWMEALPGSGGGHNYKITQLGDKFHPGSELYPDDEEMAALSGWTEWHYKEECSFCGDGYREWWSTNAYEHCQ